MIVAAIMGVELAAAGGAGWGWEAQPPPSLSDEQLGMLELTMDEVRDSPLSRDVDPKGGRSAIWRYLEAAQWRLEPARNKRVSEFFLDTLQWRQEEQVGDILLTPGAFLSEADSGKLFVRGRCLLGRPLIWVHLGRENNALDPEANVRFLIYTLVRREGERCPILLQYLQLQCYLIILS